MEGKFPVLPNEETIKKNANYVFIFSYGQLTFTVKRVKCQNVFL